MIAERLRALGVDTAGFDPLAKGYGPLFNYLMTLTTTVTRVAAGQFTAPTAYRANVSGILPVPELALWNIEKK